MPVIVQLVIHQPQDWFDYFISFFSHFFVVAFSTLLFIRYEMRSSLSMTYSKKQDLLFGIFEFTLSYFYFSYSDRNGLISSDEFFDFILKLFVSGYIKIKLSI